MGCVSSTEAHSNVSEKPVPEQAVTSKQLEKPKPQVFSIMRNGHEVIRGGMIEVKEAIEKEDMVASKIAWDKLVLFEEMHKAMEEGNGSGDSPMGFFKVLDLKADGIVTKEGLYDLHSELSTHEKAVVSAIQSSDIVALKNAYPQFQEFNESHLKREEDVMMPSIKRMMTDKQPLKKYMCKEILPTVTGSPNWEFFIKYANEMLEKYHGGMPRARVFDHALWAAATPEEWKVWNVWIKETLSEKTYSELKDVLP